MTREQELGVIERVLSGEADAFEALVLEHQNKVYSLALRMVGNEEDARDMAQEAFLRAYNSLRGFRGDSRFSVWLYRLTSNICIDFIRSRSKRGAMSLTRDGEDGDDDEIELPDERYTPERELERRELLRDVSLGLETLSSDYRDILLLREVNGLSYEEIGRALSLEEGTVKSRLFRARKKLADFLMARGNIPAGAASQAQRGGDRR